MESAQEIYYRGGDNNIAYHGEKKRLPNRQIINPQRYWYGSPKLRDRDHGYQQGCQLRRHAFKYFYIIKIKHGYFKIILGLARLAIFYYQHRVLSQHSVLIIK